MIEDSISNTPLKTNFVSHLPDLITEEDYLGSPEQKKIRVRINVNDEGVDILGDT